LTTWGVSEYSQKWIFGGGSTIYESRKEMSGREHS